MLPVETGGTGLGALDEKKEEEMERALIAAQEEAARAVVLSVKEEEGEDEEEEEEAKGTIEMEEERTPAGARGVTSSFFVSLSSGGLLGLWGGGEAGEKGGEKDRKEVVDIKA